MANSRRDGAAVEAIARAMHKGWPARIIGKAAPGWAEVLLVALRLDPPGRAAVAAALMDEPTLAMALQKIGASPEGDASVLAKRIMDAMSRMETV